MNRQNPEPSNSKTCAHNLGRGRCSRKGDHGRIVPRSPCPSIKGALWVLLTNEGGGGDLADPPRPNHVPLQNHENATFVPLLFVVSGAGGRLSQHT